MTSSTDQDIKPNALTNITLEHEAALDQLIGRRLANIREAALMTRGQLAILSGIPEMLLAENESGNDPLPLSRLRSVAVALDTNTVELIIKLLFPNP